MNDYLISDFAFVGTTIDPTPVRSYLFTRNLGYYERAYERGETDDSLVVLNHTERFEVHLRLYLAGKFKTLREVNSDARYFIDCCPNVAPAMMKLVLLQIRRHFLKNEWYELMPRLEKATAKIEKLLSTL